MKIKDMIIYEKTTPSRDGKYVDYPENLNTQISDFLQSKGISKLYSHQSEMFVKANEGKNLVITTSTASGKTLSFLLPVIEEILKNPLTRAIFIYPTKALASDQFRAIQPYIEYFGENKISVGVYDGDTSANEKSRIRKSANIILTNPEMLNYAFLPNHSKFGFDFIFSNLKYVVIDELHTYRGVFGSHFANVLVRLKRVCSYYNTAPQYLCSSATIANPLELAKSICGQEFELIDVDGSPASKKKYCLIQPPTKQGADGSVYDKTPVSTIASLLIPDLVDKDKSFIAFSKSRKGVEVVLKESRDRLESKKHLKKALKNRIAGYRGGYSPSERKEIERKMILGEIKGLISTNALELGIDIGKIDTTVLIGFPGTRASFWQQTGRAGRNGSECLNYLILDNKPLDQYLSIVPDWLFNNNSENAVIDKNNLYIQLAHIRAGAAELPLSLNDIELFNNLGEILPTLIKNGEIVSTNSKFVWKGKSFPAGDYSLRNIDNTRYKLINKENSTVITEMDEIQAFSEIHKGAVYMHDGVLFEVVSFNQQSRTAEAISFNGNYYTAVSGQSQISIIKVLNEKVLKRINVQFGDINLFEAKDMFKKIEFHNHNNLGNEQLDSPLIKEYDTESTWVTLPKNVAEYLKVLDEAKEDYFSGLCYVLKNSASMVTMTDENDLDVSWSVTEEDKIYNICIFDKYVGGLGFSEKIYDLIDLIVDNAIKIVEGCNCKSGCPACVGNYKLDKKIINWAFENFLFETANPEFIVFDEVLPKPIDNKKFTFSQLPSSWSEFCLYIEERNEEVVKIFNLTKNIKVEENSITIEIANKFYCQWAMEATNKKNIIKVLKYYVDCPEKFEFKVVYVNESRDIDYLSDKIEKRYNNLSNSKGE